MRKGLSFLWALALAACAGGGGSNPPMPPGGSSDTLQSTASQITTQSTGGTLWNIGTGASTYSYALQDLDFYPDSITIDAGDSIAFHVASGSGGDAHTVSFVPSGQSVPSPFNPNDVVPAGGTTVDGTKFVNSGILFGGQIFTLHFTKAGTYKIYCLFHEPAMVMTVVVQNAGAAYPHNAQYYLTAGENDEWVDLGAAQRSVASFPFPNFGTSIAAGIDPGLTSGPPTQSTVLRFLNHNDPTGSVVGSEGSFTVKAGTTITFQNETRNEPHTVTLASLSQIASMPPDPSVNAVAAPGVTTFDGTKIVNSGTLPPNAKFLVKFTKAGTYFYGCIYHFNSRMTGTITVTP